jgi:hypothetical protein
MKRRLARWALGAAGLALMTVSMARAADVAYTFRDVARLDTQVAGEEISGNFQLGAVNAAGAVMFVSVTDSGESSFLIEPDGKATRISKPGTPSPAGGNFGDYISNNVLINDAGSIIIAVGVDRGDGEHREHVMIDKVINQARVPVGPGLLLDPGTVIQPRSYAALNNKGEIAFAAEVTGTGAGPDGAIGVYRLVNGKGVNVARPGTKIARGAFTQAWWPQLSDSGILAFEGQISEESGTGAYTEKDGVITEIVAYGSKVPDAAGKPTSDTFAGAWSVQVNSAGDTAFLGSLESGGVGAFVYSAKDQTVRRVAGPADPAPGGGTFDGVASGYHGCIGIGEDGAVYFEGIIDGGDAVGEFRWDPADQKVGTIVRTGQTMAGIGTAGSSGVGNGIGVSSNGRVVFTIQTDDGVEHLIVASPPTAP